MSKVITRTVEAKAYSILCLNIKTMETETRTLALTKEFSTEERTLAELKKLYETAEWKLVTITGVTTTTALYVLDEAFFLSHALKFRDINEFREWSREHKGAQLHV